MGLKRFSFKTSRVTINPEMHDQVHKMFYLLCIQQNYSVADSCSSSCSCSYSSFWINFSFSCPCLPNIQPGLCSLNVFSFFAFGSSRSTTVWFDKASRLSAIFSFICCSNLALPQCFHGNVRIALYNLYLHSIFKHSSSTNQKRGNLLSI